MSEHLAAGGSAEDGIRLVELMELRGKTPGGRGTRLSPSWQPTAAEVAYATERGMFPARVDAEIEKFRNYWIAKAGAAATKRDWSATWRNWIITAMERGSPFGDAKTFVRPNNPRGPSHSTLARDYARRAAETGGSRS